VLTDDAAHRGRDPWPGVSEERRRVMAANRRRDTAPEMRLRSELHRRGLRFRVDFPIRVDGRRPVRPDVVFTRRRVAVFVDGCFWHGCPVHGSQPKSNADYWLPKLRRTQKRDRETEQALREAGWLVLRVWEHESVSAAGDRITEDILGRLPDPDQAHDPLARPVQSGSSDVRPAGPRHATIGQHARTRS
jgi:DNA mismatch endonuclease, patch repair protein